jgi:transposase-like protein
MNEKSLITPPSPSADASAPAGNDEPDVRARPGRRTVEERQQAVLELFAGKATIDQIARRLGVNASTVEGWRQDALGGVEQALRRGSGKTAAELELERKNRDLEKVVTTLSIQEPGCQEPGCSASARPRIGAKYRETLAVCLLRLGRSAEAERAVRSFLALAERASPKDVEP